MEIKYTTSFETFQASIWFGLETVVFAAVFCEWVVHHPHYHCRESPLWFCYPILLIVSIGTIRFMLLNYF